jgi:hypothetical protein
MAYKEASAVILISVVEDLPDKGTLWLNNVGVPISQGTHSGTCVLAWWLADVCVCVNTMTGEGMQAMPWLRPSVAGVPSRRSTFDPQPFHVYFCCGQSGTEAGVCQHRCVSLSVSPHQSCTLSHPSQTLRDVTNWRRMTRGREIWWRNERCCVYCRGVREFYGSAILQVLPDRPSGEGTSETPKGAGNWRK